MMNTRLRLVIQAGFHGYLERKDMAGNQASPHEICLASSVQLKTSASFFMIA